MKRDTRPAIVHEGVVAAVDATRREVKVRIAHEGSEDCSSCAAAILCHRSKGNLLTLPLESDRSPLPGQRVRIEVSASGHYRVVWLLLVLPCLLTVAAIVAAKICRAADGVAALSGIAAASLIYLTLFLMRRKLADVRFKITELNIT